MSAALSMGPLPVLALIGRRVAPPVAVRVKWITRAGSATRVLHPELEQQILGEALAGAVGLTFEFDVDRVHAHACERLVRVPDPLVPELVVELTDAVEDRLALERGELGGRRSRSEFAWSTSRSSRAPRSK